ncbi:NAD(P)-dependent oxidoreductase [Dysgonomonas sp. BGC7]|uniref:NAD(P)-dependent oxidoreductase n=1 Tax=Dysgonomonas sp. BGC7 TaxID=1658008 RepID=UPI00067FD741|nr:NAD(P)-dependent oxidoreductase [Dysgonomonas sp. BGC7]MBD8388565.1 NAD(P)-dependent oxidoreductase [Dysgonomonas sp. BGC7]
MKKIVLIGASGFVGSAILNEVLSRDIKVTAVVRNPEKIKISNPNLTIIKADVSSASEVTEFSKRSDAVISAYNPGWHNPDMYNETLRVYPEILKGVKNADVKRLLIVGGAGTLFVAPGKRVVDTGAIPEEIIGGVKSLGEFYLNTLTNEKSIDWVFFSPAGNISPGKRTGNYRLGKDDLIIDEKGESNISVQDYAKAMIDELENPQHHQERFTIGY